MKPRPPSREIVNLSVTDSGRGRRSSRISSGSVKRKNALELLGIKVSKFPPSTEAKRAVTEKVLNVFSATVCTIGELFFNLFQNAEEQTEDFVETEEIQGV